VIPVPTVQSGWEKEVTGEGSCPLLPYPEAGRFLKMKFRFSRILLALTVLLFALTGCIDKKADAADKQIAVFVPGMLEGSPTYEMMDKGVRQAADKYGATVQTVEGGFNQGEWEEKLLTLAAEDRFDLIVTSNPSMTEICQRIGEDYPNQLFLTLDGTDITADNLISIVYNHMEQAYLIGHLAGLITSSDLEGANRDLKVGLIAGQEYPDMNNSILPGFTVGFKTIHPHGMVDFRVLGNWYDAAKASELARSMFDSGVDVILPIAGGANQGVVSAAKEAGKYVVWFDAPGTHLEPGTILASSLVNQEKIAFENMEAFFRGELEGGTVLSGGVKAGFVEFDDSDENYKKYIPQPLQMIQNKMVDSLKSGKVTLKPFKL